MSGIGIANIYKFLRQAECDKHGQPAEPGKQLKDQVLHRVYPISQHSQGLMRIGVAELMLIQQHQP